MLHSGVCSANFVMLVNPSAAVRLDHKRFKTIFLNSVAHDESENHISKIEKQRGVLYFE